jgi:peptidoglycan/xylan/chitin deacetylase (PgdA/CDA1 family)
VPAQLDERGAADHALLQCEDRLIEIPIELPEWPGGAAVAISLTFDVDAESSLLGRSRLYRSRLSSLSEARYGVTRGLPRILEQLAAAGVPSTFYVPGYTAELHPEIVEAILAGEHEIAHHGYLHLRSHRIGARAQREEIERGIEALAARTGAAPAGYRSPAWELAPETLALLHDYDFAYDSSAMGDDRPYLLASNAGQLLELPVHWSLDDVPYYAFSIDLPARLGDAAAMRNVWLAEVASARRERRHVTLTMHPEIIGRGYRADELRRLIESIQEQGSVWFARHGDIADLLRPALATAHPMADR